MPVPEVRRDGVADGRTMVAEAGVAQSAGRLQIKDMVLAVVAGKPKVPHPYVGQAERH